MGTLTVLKLVKLLQIAILLAFTTTDDFRDIFSYLEYLLLVQVPDQTVDYLQCFIKQILECDFFLTFLECFNQILKPLNRMLQVSEVSLFDEKLWQADLTRLCAARLYEVIGVKWDVDSLMGLFVLVDH